MAVVKVVELLAQSEKGWEDAVKMALQEASKTIRDIKSIYVKEFQAIVENDNITHYRVNVKVSFTVQPHGGQGGQGGQGGRSGEPMG